jgi:hypothetical protein
MDKDGALELVDKAARHHMDIYSCVTKRVAIEA